MNLGAGVGRIEGAIARAAEDVYTDVLDEAERALAEPVFIRLVRLGDTGGATRRPALHLACELRLPPLIQTAQGTTRRVGVEIEFME